MNKVGIIAAMDVEMKQLLAAMQVEKEESISGILFREGTIGARPVVLAKCGPGKVNAAVCTQTMILKYGPDIILNSGVAGYLSDKLPVAGVVIADRAVEHDIDSSAVGDPLGFISGLEIIYLPISEAVTAGLVKAAESRGIAYEVGTVASGDQFVSSEERRQFIKAQFGGIAAEMEGAAVAHVCYMNGTACGILRAISDNGNEDSSTDYMVNLRKAAEASAAVMLAFCKNPD